MYTVHQVNRQMLSVKFNSLDIGGNKHWPVPSNRLQCHMSSTCRVMRKVSVNCQKCEVGSCVDKKFHLGTSHKDAAVNISQVQHPLQNEVSKLNVNK
jgi:hypothetical protein